MNGMKMRMASAMDCVDCPGLTRTKWCLRQVQEVVRGASLLPEEVLQRIGSVEVSSSLSCVVASDDQRRQIEETTSKLDKILASLGPHGSGEGLSLLDQADCDFVIALVQFYVLFATQCTATSEDRLGREDGAGELCQLKRFSSLLAHCQTSSWFVGDAHVKCLSTCLRAIFVALSCRQCERSSLFFASLIPFLQSIVVLHANHRKLFAIACEELVPAAMVCLSGARTGSLNPSVQSAIGDLLSVLLFRGDGIISELSSVASLDAFVAASFAPTALPAFPAAVDLTLEDLATLTERIQKPHASKSQKKPHYYEKIFQVLAHAPGAAAQGAACIFDLFVQKSATLHDEATAGADSHDSAVGYRKHVCRVLQVLAAIVSANPSPVRQASSSSSMQEHFFEQLESETNRASVRQALLQVCVSRLHSLPQHASVQKHVHWLFGLFHRSLLVLHCSTLLANSLPLVDKAEPSPQQERLYHILHAELDCLSWMTDLHHPFLVEHKTSLLMLLDAHVAHPLDANRPLTAFYLSGDAALYGEAYNQVFQAKRRLWQRMWHLFGHLRVLDAFCKALVTVGNQPCPYHEASWIQSREREKVDSTGKLLPSTCRYRRHSTLSYLLGHPAARSSSEKDGGHYDDVVVQTLRSMPNGQWTNVFHSVLRVPYLTGKVGAQANGQAPPKEATDALAQPSAPSHAPPPSSTSSSSTSERHVLVNSLQVLLFSYLLHTQHCYLSPQSLSSSSSISQAKAAADSFLSFLLPLAYLTLHDLASLSFSIAYSHFLPWSAQAFVALCKYLTQAYTANLSELLVPISLQQGSQVIDRVSLAHLLVETALPMLSQRDGYMVARIETALSILPLVWNIQAKTSWKEAGEAFQQCVQTVHHLLETPPRSASFPSASSCEGREKDLCAVLVRHVPIFTAVPTLIPPLAEAFLSGIQAWLTEAAQQAHPPDSLDQPDSVKQRSTRSSLGEVREAFHTALAMDCVAIQQAVDKLMSCPWRQWVHLARLSLPAGERGHNDEAEEDPSLREERRKEMLEWSVVSAAVWNLLPVRLLPANRLLSVLAQNLSHLISTMQREEKSDARPDRQRILERGLDSTLHLLHACLAPCSLSALPPQRLSLAHLSPFRSLLSSRQRLCTMARYLSGETCASLQTLGTALDRVLLRECLQWTVHCRRSRPLWTILLEAWQEEEVAALYALPPQESPSASSRPSLLTAVASRYLQLRQSLSSLPSTLPGQEEQEDCPSLSSLKSDVPRGRLPNILPTRWRRLCQWMGRRLLEQCQSLLELPTPRNTQQDLVAGLLAYRLSVLQAIASDVSLLSRTVEELICRQQSQQSVGRGSLLLIQYRVSWQAARLLCPPLSSLSTQDDEECIPHQDQSSVTDVLQEIASAIARQIHHLSSVEDVALCASLAEPLGSLLFLSPSSSSSPRGSSPSTQEEEASLILERLDSLLRPLSLPPSSAINKDGSLLTLSALGMVNLMGGLVRRAWSSPPVFPALLNSFLRHCNECLGAPLSRTVPFSSGEWPSLDSPPSSWGANGCRPPTDLVVGTVVIDQLHSLHQSFQKHLEERAPSRLRIVWMQHGRLLCHHSLSLLTHLADSLSGLSAEEGPKGRDEGRREHRVSVVHYNSQRLVLVLLSLAKGWLSSPAQAIPILCTCLSQVMKQLYPSWDFLGRRSAESLAQLIVRVVIAWMALQEVQTQRSILLLALLHALSELFVPPQMKAVQAPEWLEKEDEQGEGGGEERMMKKRKRGHGDEAGGSREKQEEWVRFLRESVFPMLFPLLEKLGPKEKEKVFAQLPSADRALFNDVQEVYTRNYKYKGY